VGSSESYGRDFGIPTGHAFEPGYAGEPPPERRTFWFYLTAAIGALLALGLYTVIAIAEVNLTGEGFLETLFGALLSFWGLIWAVPTVAAFIMLIFKPTRGFATGFLAASAVGLLVCLAIPVLRNLLA
jgi:hypothetical protein